MGYQESFIGGSPKKFNLAKRNVLEIGKNYYEDQGVFVGLVVTLNKNTPLLGKKGDKFLYVCGERYLQNHLEEFFNDMDYEGVGVVFCEELPKEVQDNGYDQNSIYPNMVTKYFSVEEFSFE